MICCICMYACLYTCVLDIWMVLFKSIMHYSGLLTLLISFCKHKMSIVILDGCYVCDVSYISWLVVCFYLLNCPWGYLYIHCVMWCYGALYNVLTFKNPICGINFWWCVILIWFSLEYSLAKRKETAEVILSLWASTHIATGYWRH